MGYLIIALRNNFYYGLAYNLCLSLLTKSAKSITILTDKDGERWFNEHPNVCENLIIAQREHYTEDGRFNPFLLKTYIYDYSPYQRTIYLDADTMFLYPFRDIGELETQYNGISFSIQEFTRYTKSTANQCKMLWLTQAKSTLDDVWTMYELPDDAVYPEYNSSFILFDKSDTNRKYFGLVKYLYLERRVNYKALGGSYPDELAFNLASAISGNMSDKKTPIYFHWETKMAELDEIRNNYYFIGLAGGRMPSKLINYYTSLSKRLGSPYSKFDYHQKYFFNK